MADVVPLDCGIGVACGAGLERGLAQVIRRLHQTAARTGTARTSKRHGFAIIDRKKKAMKLT